MRHLDKPSVQAGRSEALDQVADSLCLTVFVNAGLTLEQASTALMVSRRVVEDVESWFDKKDRDSDGEPAV